MDISLTEDQRLLQDTVAGFARDHADPASARALETAKTSFDAMLWRQIGDLGFAGAPLPEIYGGSGASVLELSLIVEALAAHAVATPIFASVIEAGMLLNDCAHEELKAAWLPGLASGQRIMTVAWLETRRAFDIEWIQTRLNDDGAGAFLSGRKHYVRDAEGADAIVCLARVNGGELALSVVERTAPGVSLERMPASGGESLWTVSFDKVEVSPDAIVQGNGIADAIDRLAQRGAALKACELAGIGQAALDLAVEYAGQRQQFGVPIGSFQAVQHHCAEMFRDVCIVRLLARQACARLDTNRDARREVAMAKAKASEAIPAVTRLSHQIHGAIGYYRDYPLELFFHRAIAAQAAFGDALHHRRVLADMLASDPESFKGDNRHGL